MPYARRTGDAVRRRLINAAASAFGAAGRVSAGASLLYRQPKRRRAMMAIDASFGA